MRGGRLVIQLLLEAGDELFQGGQAGGDFFHLPSVVQQLNGNDVIRFLFQLLLELIKAQGDAADFRSDIFLKQGMNRNVRRRC